MEVGSVDEGVNGLEIYEVYNEKKQVNAIMVGKVWKGGEYTMVANQMWKAYFVNVTKMSSVVQGFVRLNAQSVNARDFEGGQTYYVLILG